MASPQVENGFTKIANELFEAMIRVRVPGEAMQVLLFILRQTYGYQKKSAVISLSQFYLATGIIKPSIIRALKTLESMNLISKKANNKNVSYCINKDYSTWKPLAKKLTLAKKLKNISNNANKRLQKSKRNDSQAVDSQGFTETQRNKEKINICDSSESPSLSQEKNKPKGNGKDPRVSPLINYFHSLCKEELDQEPTIEGVKDGAAIKRTLTENSEERIKNIFDWYIKSPKALEHGLKISVALSNHSISEYEKKGKWLYEG